MSKLIAATASIAAAAALALPSQAQAAPLVVVKAQVLQPGCGTGILGTTGSSLFGTPLTICV